MRMSFCNQMTDKGLGKYNSVGSYLSEPIDRLLIKEKSNKSRPRS